LLLRQLGQFPVAEISSSIAKDRRQKILSDFRDGSVPVLICSDHMARGMDVEGVTSVVNYEPPRQFRIYLHRAGRTARAGQKGVVYTLLAQDEVKLP
jgi:superfamily II DNA/RNA helicase